MRMIVGGAAGFAAVAGWISACASGTPSTQDRTEETASVAIVPAPAGSAAASSSGVAPAPAPPARACPADMLLVDTIHCPQLERRCLKDELNAPNHITICHRFAEEPGRCEGEPRRERFCIDRYEYPNEQGARPPVMVDFYDAMALCEEKGKRLCWESEWISACEGPKATPFPYGYARDPSACNIDNPWVEPSLKKMYDADERVAGAELTRLNQGVPSGSKPGCKSGFDVHDQTGNVDEWVMLEQKRGRGGYAGLKGGGWGHVRNACRPVTTSHAPEFKYYFVSFRCCRDAAASEGGATVWTPPPIPREKHKPKAMVSRGFSIDRGFDHAPVE